MDFREFRSQVVQVPFTFEGVEFWVGYRPREILEEDLEFLAQLQRARVADVDVEALAASAPPPNRAARRRAEKAERVARATSAGTPPPPAPSLVDHMERLIADWSLTWDGEPWPVCRESFKQIEPLMRTAMVAAIVEDYLDRPNRLTSSRPSSAGTASGPTGPISASAPSSGAAGSSAGVDSSPGTT